MKDKLKYIVIAIIVFLLVRGCFNGSSSSQNIPPVNSSGSSVSHAAESSVHDEQHSNEYSYLYSSYYNEDYESSVDPEEEYWNNVPEIGNKTAFINYAKNCINSRMEEIPFRLAQGFSIESEDILKFGELCYCSSTDYNNNRIKYNVQYRKGIKIADAYLSGDSSNLTDEEKRIYSIAEEIVSQAKNEPTQLRKELYMHDAVINSCTYYTDDTLYSNTLVIPRFCSVLGVFIDGKANCQGYSEAFCMLCKMAGFNTEIVPGDADNGDGTGYSGHTWNTIVLNGLTYFVDTTWNDEKFVCSDIDLKFPTYTYFNAPAEVIKADHKWDEDYVEGRPVQTIDKNYFYCTNEYDDEHFGEYYDSEDSVFNAMTNYLSKGTCRLHHMMIKTNGIIPDQDSATNKFSNTLSRSLNTAFSYNLLITTLGDYSYYTIYISSP